MKHGEEDRETIEEAKRAEREIALWAARKQLRQPFDDNAWTTLPCGRSPLPVVIEALINEVDRLREELDELKRGAS